MGPTLEGFRIFLNFFSSFVDISFCSQGAGGKDGARDWAGHRLSSSSHILCLSSASHIFCSPLVKFQDKITKINAWSYPRDRIKICVHMFRCTIVRSFQRAKKISMWFQ